MDCLLIGLAQGWEYRGRAGWAFWEAEAVQQSMLLLCQMLDELVAL
jgi:hypothetical protein